MNIKIPLGIDDFAKLREENFYYIDKTAFIRRILETQFEATLITRPRRFGKTLTMSMLEDFFDISRDSRAHFEGLKISEEPALCEAWMNQWPVVFLSMKSVEGLDFQDAYGMLEVLIANLCKKYAFLGESDKTDPDDKRQFQRLKSQEANKQNLKNSLVLLTRMLNAYYGKQVILLMDEYDVPLAKASENGYYDEMMDMIRALLGEVLKTNPHLKFAVVTGCLRISKESIFTGLNNLVVDTIAGDGFSEYIGFTPEEVRLLLADADLMDHEEEARRWYDGYRFGAAEVYCPWSVLNYVRELQRDKRAIPGNYWANTSHNGIIYRFISREDLSVNDKFETLMSGGTVITPVEENLTYDTVHSTEENLWSLLYLTGYLTRADRQEEAIPAEKGKAALRIPNEEVKSVFEKAIVEWFGDTVRAEDRSGLFRAFWEEDTRTAEEILSNLLFNTISYYDYDENYYHAFLAGIFTGAGYSVESNYEYGTGRPDIVVKDRRNRRVMVFEVKHAGAEREIAGGLKEALRQIEDRRYLDGVEEGFRIRLGYGAVFYKKECYIAKL